MKTLFNAIKVADEVELDCCFALLRERKFGILRKVKGMALILDIDEEEVLNEVVKDSSGRLIDTENRHLIASALVERSKQIKQNNE